MTDFGPLLAKPVLIFLGAGAQAGVEPVDPLFRGPVGERLGADVPPGLGLDPVVAERIPLAEAGRAHELALRLMAMGQGISVMAHVHNDPALLRREKEHLGYWLDQLAEGNDACA